MEGPCAGGGGRAVVTPEDALIVRESDGRAVVPVPPVRRLVAGATSPPSHPGAGAGTRRDRAARSGPALRDRYVLRLIALDRASTWSILTLAGRRVLTFARHDRALHADYQNIMNALNGGGAAAARVRGVLGYLRKAFEYSPTHLLVLAAIFLATPPSRPSRRSGCGSTSGGPST